MTLNIGLILPDVMGTYGDNGNARILYQRAMRRGIDTVVHTISIFDPVPESLDLYLMGGAEDFAQQLAVDHLKEHPGLQKAVNRGTPVLAICAGMQILGHSWSTASGETHTGLGLIDIVSKPMEHRAIGDALAYPSTKTQKLGIDQPLSGFENHRGGSILGDDAEPLATIEHGVGNSYYPDHETPPYEGVIQGSVLATYFHGPLLARNPQVADVLLAQAVGTTLEPLEVEEQIILRKQRFDAAKQRPTSRAEAIIPPKV